MLCETSTEILEPTIASGLYREIHSCAKKISLTMIKTIKRQYQLGFRKYEGDISSERLLIGNCSL